VAPSNPLPELVCLISPESVVPAAHPIRTIQARVDLALRRMSRVFDRMYAGQGRPSIPPERLLKAKVLIAHLSVRSENPFVEQLGYNLLCRWFLDMDLSEAVFDNSTFSKNQTRLMEHDAAPIFFAEVVDLARAKGRKIAGLDGRTARTAGYALSQKVRKRIEEGFGWMKTVGAFRKTRFKGSGRTQLSAYLVGAACNLVRMAKLGWSPPRAGAPC
jgi:transposase